LNRERLDEVQAAYKEYKELQEKIIECENMRISPRGAAYGSERVQTSLKGDIQPDALERVEKLLALYNAQLKECAELIYEFETALLKLNSLERQIMRHYYVDCMTWEKVCVAMNLSWTSLHRYRRAALEKMLDD